MVTLKTSCHMGRTTGTGRHNSRTIDYNKDKNDHIDRTRGTLNVYWDIYNDTYVGEPKEDFSIIERRYYAETFSDVVEAQNMRNTRSGHPERNKTPEDLLRSPRTRPDEIIFQVGDMNTQAKFTPEGREKLARWALYHVCNIVWNLQTETGAGFVPLDIALHRDETGGDHIHVRGVYVSLDPEGHPMPRQKAALMALGYDRPNPLQPEGRYNNSKITFTSDLQQRFNDLMRQSLRSQHVAEIDHSGGKKHLDTAEYKQLQLAIARAREAQRQESQELIR